MTAALLAALLATGDCPEARALNENQRAAACALVEKDGPNARVDPSQLDAIYARPEFARARDRDSGAFKDWMRRVMAWLEKALGSRGAESYSVTTRFLTLLIGSLVVLWASARLLRRRAKQNSTQAAPIENALGLEAPADHLQRAKQLLSSDPRAASREGLFALLSALERARLARPDRVKTNRELAAGLKERGASDAVATQASRAFDWYDRAWYSLSPVQKEEAERFVHDVEQLSGQLSR